MNAIQNSLIIALDVPSLREARRFVTLLKKEVSFFKVGLRLFTAAGPDAVRMIHDKGGKVFLDLKFHDIPNTVAQACEVASKLGVAMVNVHACGGVAMLQAARKAIPFSGPRLLGVTVLTSDQKNKSTVKEVISRSLLCQKLKLDGVVCSPQEIEAVRKACGKDFIIVTPGIRLSNDKRGDQRRIATPGQAIQNGANYIVVGRPLLSSKDPVGFVHRLLADS